MKTVLTVVVACFCVFCGWLVLESGVFEAPQTGARPCILLQQTAPPEGSGPSNEAAVEQPVLEAAEDTVAFVAEGGAERSPILGSVDPQSGYKYKLELSSKAAAIRSATFSGFKDRDFKDPKPLVVISPTAKPDGSEVLAMANTSFVLVDEGLQLALDELDWKSGEVETDADDGSQSVSFEATIKAEGTGEPAVKLTKTFRITPGSYLLECDLAVENLGGGARKIRFNMNGPGGFGREGFRSDMRKVIGGFREPDGKVGSERLGRKKLYKAKSRKARRLEKEGAGLLWAAAVNKYFAAIVVPAPEEGKDYCDWIAERTREGLEYGPVGQFYNPDGDSKAGSGDETVGLVFPIATSELGAAGQAGSSKAYKFQIYLGPKDKSLFDDNELYRSLGFYQTIDFAGCCCPTCIINPLAFGVLAIMKWMHGFIPNYGWVIIILVLLFRLLMHPITKKSQVSMSKLQKVLNDPEIQEIKKKYAKKPLEMQKHISEFQKQKGVSPASGFTSMLPMMVQMPIWIALWSAVYTSIDLRGAAFLPFWITDLSVPDAAWRFDAFTIPLLGSKIASLNLLPILMGLAFYLQQKLMPSQASASANPQAAQQQKMMMIMMPLLFPVMLYNAPSGVNLYIMASTFAGVIEQFVIRKHIKEKEQEESKGLVATTSKTGGKVKKKKPKPFFRT